MGLVLRYVGSFESRKRDGSLILEKEAAIGIAWDPKVLKPIAIFSTQEAIVVSVDIGFLGHYGTVTVHGVVLLLEALLLL